MRIDWQPDGTHQDHRPARCRWFMALLLTTTTLPGLLTKTSWFVTIRLIRLSTVKSKSQVGATNCSAYDKTSDKNYTHRKLNTHKLNNPNAEKIVINRNEYSRIQSIYTNYAKITRYNMSKKQGMNNNIYTSLFARKAAATSEKSTKHTTKTNKQKRGKKTTLKSGRLVNSVTTNEL